MSVGSVSDVSLVQDEELLRKMWQETEDYGKKKEIRSHMYKIREARLKDFYGTSGNESSTNSESRQHSTITTRSSGGLKGSELSTRHADNLIDHSFLSLKSKEIRDSESPTKDSYKITETKKIDDRDWNIVESNESSKDGKKHTTSRIATTSGKQDVDGGEMNYAAKSEQKASVFKDGDDKNFTKSVGASSQNVIKQEAFGGDENNKFYSTSTTSSSSSKFTSEQRSTTGDIDLADYQQQPNTNVKSSRMMKTSAKDDAKVTTTAAAAATTKTQEETPSVRNSQQITRTVYTENIPNEFKNHPNYTDGNTKVTTETKTLPDGSTVTTTRYETKGATQHSTQSQNSSTHVSTSSSNQQQINRIQIVDENSRIGTVQKDDDNTRIQIIKDQESGSKMHVDDSSNQTRIIRSERIEDHRFGEDDIKRRQDLAVLGRSDKNVENVEVVITKQLPVQETRTVTTTVTKNINTSQGKDEAVRDNIVERRGVHQEFRPSEEHISKTTTVTKNINTTYDNQQVASDHFLNTERNETTKSIKKPEDAKPIIEPAGKHTETIEIEIIRQQEPQISQKKTPKLIEEPVNYTKEPRAKDEPKYEQPERRKPITPGKSEWDDRATPTDGQYDTTYRTDYVPRRISVEVSPTHDAFARSLRSVSPDRVSKIGSTRSLRTNSTTSLRKSPERAGNKTRSSPANSRPISPSKKAKSPEKYDSKPRHGSPPYHDYRTPKMVSDVQHATNTDTITKRKKTTDVDSNTLTRRKDAEGPRSRSVSPTSTTSDFEFVRHRNDIVTDLDIDDTKVLSKQTLEDRPTNLELSKKPQKITEKSLTSPLTEFRKTPTSPTKRSPTKETHEPDKSKKPFRRTDTYEERCKEILGISNGQDTHRKASLPTTPGDRIQSPTKPKKFIETSPNKSKDESPRRKSPEKKPSEFPSQIRKSPQKEPLEPYPEKVKDVKRGPGVAEFPAQIRKSPEKQPLEPYPGKPKDVKKRPSVAEFPAQIRKSPEKQPLEPYPEKRKETKKGPSISEFPGQIRKSPEKQPLEPYPEKLKDAKKGPSVAEFPSQIRKSSEREPLEPYPDKIKYAKKAPGVSEFPAQIKKSPSKEPLEPYPEKRKDVRTPSDVAEFPSQIRKSPEKQPLAPYPEKPKDAKRGPSVAEFPSQIRKSSEREPLEPYPEKPKETKKGPSVSEFPGQIRKSPEKQPLEPYPEKPKDAKRAPGVSEFPAQIKKLPSREPLEPYQEKPKHSKDSPTIQEFPRKSPQKEEHSEDVKKRPQHETPRDSKPSDLYAEILRGRSESPEREPLEYFDKPLERSSSRVSLDDLQLVKTDRVSLDDLPSIGKPQRKISLSDLDQKQPDDYVDNFMTSERIDSEITLKKYKDDSIGPVIEVPPPVSSKIDVKKMKKRARNDKKSKIGRTTTIRGSDTESSTDEEDDIEDQIIEDICDVVECVETIATRRETSKLKAKPKGPQVVEDFVTVTKAQLLDSSSSRIPVEEVIHTKKFINELSKDEEEDRKTVLTKTVLTTTEFIKPNKTVKKDSPKKSPITNDVKRRTEIKITPKTPEMKKIATIVTRRIDDKGTYDTEYTDQYKRKVPKGPSKVTTAKITLTANEKKPQIKKKVEIVRKIEGVKSQAKRYTSPEKKPETKLPTKSKIATTTSSTAKTQKITVTEAQPARRHVVSTIINIKPKVKPETISKTIHKTTVTRTITAPKTITTKITPKSITGKPKKKLLPNGYASTDDEEEEEDASEIEVKVKETLKTDRNQQHRKKSPFTTKTTGETKKCITTKSILIENAVADEREIIVDLRRSKSSREGTPDRICPYPVSSNADLGRPRYPDRVIEPDDAGFQRPKQRISDIPLDEMEDVTESERITEVRQEENNRRQDRKTEVESTDECLLSVNEKVNKFLTTAEQVTNKPIDAKPAPKVERPKLEIEESLKEDECLLSVSDKVNKFIATAEQLSSTTKTTTTATKDKIVNVVESEENVRRSVSPEKKMDASPKRKTPDRSSPRIPPLDQEETPKTSRRLSKDDAKPAVSSPTGARLRSTETIKKAKALFENISERDMARQMDILSRPSVFEGRKLKKAEDEKEEEEEVKVARTRLTYDEVKRSASPEKVLRSDWPSKEDPHYMSPLDRTIKEHTRRNQVDDDNDDEIEHLRSSRDSSVDRDVPHYMLPLDRSVRERSPHKDNLKQLDDIMSRSFGHDEVDVVKTSASTTTTSTKFGVTLRRTDSGRVITGGHRRSSAASSTTGGDTQQVDEDLNVEEIFDLEFLEKLLETIVGYDIRRRIRAQIRLVKRSIEENAVVESSIKKRITSSPTKDVPPKRTVIDKKKQSEELSKQITQLSEYQSSYSSNRKTSMEYTETRSKSSSPSRPMEKRSRAPTKSPSPLRKTGATELDGGDGTKKTTASPRIFQTDLKKTKPLSKTTMVDEKPEWITQRTLRKVSETSAPVKRSVTSTTTTKKQITTKTIDHEKPTDVITSSYGVGPMDENGSPLFGLKALRAQNKTEKTKVQGTVIRSHYHSENGGEPEGEISITKFSTDPEDLGTKNVTRDSKGAGGLTSVTTTQKFGYKGTPPLKKITTGATDKNQVETTKTNVRTGSKVTRRGSVKEMSQKFIENAVDTLKNERQSSYPKAGLILRTSSFKDTTSNGTNSNTSREGSPATQELHQRVVTTTVKKSTTSTASDGRKGDTFLSNKSKVTGVQDVISRMRNDTAEIEVEETAEDAEARNLLNKFIGAQVLLSGMESHAASKSARTTATSTASATSSSGDVKRTTKITTTTTNSESSTPNTVTRTFTHPITPELLNTIWDEATLKLLLEQSTNYEDRRIIRARLRDIMAEQEACAELVEKASNEAVTQGSNTVHGTTATRTFTEAPITTTTSQTTTRVTSQQQQQQQQVKKPMSPFAKFRQLDKQNSLNSPPSTPKSPGGGPLFKFTDTSLTESANTVKQRLLRWCQIKTKEYENIQLDNFSTSWADGMAFCALIHHFLPDAFDYKVLNPKNRRHNFTLAFRVAEEKADIAPLLDVDDMVLISKPDWKCVFTYVQSIYRRFKDED